MGFMDTIKEWFGATKSKTGDMADKTGDTAGDAWDKAKDVSGDVSDKAKDVADDVTDKFGGDDETPETEQ